MVKRRLIFLLCCYFTTGCASNSQLNRNAEHHDKTGDYYESIGQLGVAEHERNLAQKKREQSLEPQAVIFELLERDDK